MIIVVYKIKLNPKPHDPGQFKALMSKFYQGIMMHLSSRTLRGVTLDALASPTYTTVSQGARIRGPIRHINGYYNIQQLMV